MKSLSERIAERAHVKQTCTPNCNRAVVLALRKDIAQARADGWSVLAIYQTLWDEGRVTFSYQAFRRHVNRLLPGQTEAKIQPDISGKTASTLPLSGPSGFHFKPVPDKKELL